MRWIVLFVLGCAIFAPVAGCHDECETEETKCDGTKVMVCNSESDWELVMDCSEIEPVEFGWMCCVDSMDGIHSCLPAEECVEPVDGGEL